MPLTRHLRHAAVFAFVLVGVAIAITGMQVLLTQPVLLSAGKPLDAAELRRVVAIEGIAVPNDFFTGWPLTLDAAHELAWWRLHQQVHDAVAGKDVVAAKVDSVLAPDVLLTLGAPDNSGIGNDLYLVYSSGTLYVIGALFLYFRHRNLTGFLLTLHLLPAAVSLFAFGVLNLRPVLFPYWPYKWLLAAEVAGNIGYLAGVHYLLHFPSDKRVLQFVPRYLPPLLYALPLLHAVLYLLGVVSYPSSFPVATLLVSLMLVALVHSFLNETDRFIRLQLGFMLLVICVGYVGFFAFYAYASVLSIKAFDTVQLALVSLTSLYAMGATMENVTLYQQKAAGQEKSRTEREQLREELHDNVLNRLATITLLADKVLKANAVGGTPVEEKITAIRGEASSYAQYARGLLWITDDTCYWNDFGAHLRSMGYGLTAAHNLDFDLSFTETMQPTQLPLVVKVCVYKILVESIYNTIKHARATQVTVQLELADDELAFAYADNGAGFDPSNVAPGHYGLMHMRRRAADIGGSLRFGPNDAGAQLHLRTPIRI